MSGFGDADKANRGNKEKAEWKILETLAEVKKNKTDTLKITRVQFGNLELINLQVWRNDPDTNKNYPLKDQKVSFQVEYKDKVAEAIASAI